LQVSVSLHKITSCCRICCCCCSCCFVTQNCCKCLQRFGSKEGLSGS
jgi:hypothetical protein